VVCIMEIRQKDSFLLGIHISEKRTSKFTSLKYELNNLYLSGDACLTLFTLIGAHSVVCVDANKLKNERKCTPRIVKTTKNVRHTLKK